MKTVCAKHEYAYETECPYCEKPAAPAASPRAPERCVFHRTGCEQSPAWVWHPQSRLTRQTNPPNVYLCVEHDAEERRRLSVFLEEFTMERLP